MTDEAKQTAAQQEDDQNLWRAMYTTEKGWSEGVAFADHLSFAAPALAEVGGTLYCVHRGARQEGEGQKHLPVRWTSFTPASVQPFLTALDKAARPLPQGATAEQTAAWQAKLEAAAKAVEAARKWTPDAYAYDCASTETPALVNDGGTLRMVFTSAEEHFGGWSTHLYETELIIENGSVFWGRPKEVSEGHGALLAPALAVFNGTVHLLCVDLQSGRLIHAVRDAKGKWTPLRDDKNKRLATPWIDADRLREEWEESKDGMRANLSLAAHDGKLHLVHNASGLLWHAVFDGTTWTGTEPWTAAFLPSTTPVEENKGGDAALSRRTAALASYDGKLHAVYPGDEGDALRHSTWTQDGGWTRPVVLEGHDSNNTPALLAFKEGPAGARGAAAGAPGNRPVRTAHPACTARTAQPRRRRQPGEDRHRQRRDRLRQ